MKTILICIFSSVLLMFTFSLSAQERVKYVSETNGCVSLQVTAYGKKCVEAIGNAELLGIKHMLFRGLPESVTFRHPLTQTTEHEIIETHSDYFNQLFSERYKSFILSSTAISKFTKDITRRKCITINVTINAQALKRDLENYKVIRKFGL